MELYEASYYGLLERNPVLLTTVNVDAVNAVSMSDFPISEAVQWFIHYHNTYNSSTRNNYICTESLPCICVQAGKAKVVRERTVCLKP